MKLTYHLRTAVRAGVVVLMTLVLLHANYSQAAPAKVQEKPFVTEHYYKVKWGYGDEFFRLFKKNHYPLLKRHIELGNALSVTAEVPVHHGTEDSRWDFRIRIVWKNVQIAHDESGDDAILKQLFPDQELFKREEQRRFEILLGHWDVPVGSINLDER